MNLVEPKIDQTAKARIDGKIVYGRVLKNSHTGSILLEYEKDRNLIQKWISVIKIKWNDN